MKINDSQDTLELAACQLANVVGILAGIGAIPFLRDRQVRFWRVEAAVGVIVIAVGLFFLVRRARRQRQAGGAPGLFQRLLAFLRRLAGSLRHTWAWARSHLPGRRKVADRQVASDLPAVEENPPPAVPPAAPGTPSPPRDLVLLPYLTVLIGGFVLLPAALVASLQYVPVPNLDQIAMYFSAPAILIWMIGEIPNIFPKLAVRPKSSSIVTGMLKSGLQVLSAVLVWVFLGLARGREEHPWLLVSAIGLALGGLVLGFVSEAAERRRLQTRPQNNC